MKKTTVLVLALASLALGACSSIDGQIRDLEDRDRIVSAQIRTLTDERRALVKLMTALQMHRDEDSSRTAQALEKAREDYDRVRTD